MNNTLNTAIRRVARNLCVDQKLVESVYKSYWYFIKEQISSTTLKDMSQEEFDSSVTNFNLPFLGKLYADYSKIEKYRRQLKFYEHVKAEKSKANRLSGISD